MKFEEFDNDGHVSIKGNISTITYQDIADFLGKEEFCMHYDCTDSQRHVCGEDGFNNVKKSLMDRYGDVMLVITKGVYWFDEVTIDDEQWKKDSKEYCDKKMAWCNKYGCD